MATAIERPQCKDCAFFSVDSSDLRQGVCHRFPPSWTLVATPQGVGSAPAVPITRVDNWCGEYKPKVVQ